MPIRGFNLELKSLSETGRFTGLASAYGNVDQGGDVVMPGAFARTLMDGKQRPLLWQHDQPVGLCSLTDTPSGLLCEAQLSLGVQLAADAYTLLKDGVVRGLSIGFLSVKEQFVGGVRQLLECKLFEVSLTPFPMNEMATVSQVKSIQNQRTEILAAAQLLKQFYEQLTRK